MRKSGVGGLVYSTDGGRMCPNCRKALTECSCATAASAGQGNGVLRVSRETRGRGGKTVTLIRDAALNPVDLAVLGKGLRTACGSGGTVKDGVIEVQGDHCERVIEYLRKDGFTVKRAGG